jgi:hypothetical protein
MKKPFRSFREAYDYLASRDYSFIGSNFFKKGMELLVVVKASSGYWMVEEA